MTVKTISFQGMTEEPYENEWVPVPIYDNVRANLNTYFTHLLSDDNGHVFDGLDGSYAILVNGKEKKPHELVLINTDEGIISELEEVILNAEKIKPGTHAKKD